MSGERTPATMRIQWTLLASFLAVAPLSAWAAPVSAPQSAMAGYQKGVKPDFLLATEQITPEALFGKDLEPDLTSFGQGGSGDCYALSAAKMYANRASGAYGQQKEVLKAVFLNEDGSLRRSKAGVPQARFFQKDRKTGEYKAVLVDYDGRVPMHAGKPVFAAEAHKNGQAWGPLFEEAYTKFRDEEGGGARKGYYRTGNGGYSLHVMAALTGQPAEHFQLTPKNVGPALEKIHAALDRGDVVTTGTNTVAVIKQRMKQAIALGQLDRRSLALKIDDEKVVVPGHEYGLVSATKTAVKTSNPWNSTAILRHGSHGIGTVKNALYPVLYGDVDIGRGTPKDRAPRRGKI